MTNENRNLAAVYIRKAFGLAIFIIISNLLVGFICVFVIVQLYSARLKESEERARLDDSRKFLIDFPNPISQNWEIGQIFFEGQEDIAGWDSSIVGQSSLTFRNTQNPSASIRLHIVTYTDAQQARRRYSDQEDWIFVRDFGVPQSQQIFSYGDLSLPQETNPAADQYHIACQNALFNVRCGGLFLYSNHVVFIDAFTVIDLVRYLSNDDLVAVFSAIDQKMTSRL